MNANTRKALYALIPLIITALVAYGIVTGVTGVLWGNVAVMTVGFAYAASRATGNRLLDPTVRRAAYVLLPGVVALIGGYWSIDVGLWSALILGILGAVYAIANVDPDDTGTDPDDAP